MSRTFKLGALLCALLLLLTACASTDPGPDTPDGSTTDPNVSVSQSTVISTDATVDTTTTEGSAASTDEAGEDTTQPTQSESEQQDTTSSKMPQASASGTKPTSSGKPTSGTTKDTKPVTTKDTKPVITKDTKPVCSSTVGTTTTTRRTKPIVTVSGTTTTTTTAAPTKPTDYPDKHPGSQWKLIWSDEFGGTALDRSKWNIEDGGGNSSYIKKASNVKVEGGKCVLTLIRDNSTAGYEYSGASITTAHKFSFQYGRLEFRAKLPYGQGVWPALWTMGDYYLTTSDQLGWPRCGEIDVMELLGKGGAEDENIRRENKKVTGNLHWGANRDVHQENGSYLFLKDSASMSYHLYAIEWDEKEIVWYVDDVETNRVSLDDPTMLDSFHQKHWIIMNVAMGNFEPYFPDARTPVPQSMYVDYVRVYQKK